MPNYIEGFDELVELFFDLGKNIIDELDPISRAAAEMVAVDAKEGCPVAAEDHINSYSKKKNPRGYLRDSIGIKREGKNSKDKVVYQVKPLKKDAFYGVFVEYGANGATAQPFMRNAADKNWVKVNKLVASEINKIVKQNGGG